MADDFINNENTEQREQQPLTIRFAPNEPERAYCETTGEFEYADEKLRELARKRAQLKQTKDKLEIRQNAIKKHLSREVDTDGTSLDNYIGKTGDSKTGKVSERDKKVAEIQTKHMKEYIKGGR